MQIGCGRRSHIFRGTPWRQSEKKGRADRNFCGARFQRARKVRLIADVGYADAGSWHVENVPHVRTQRRPPKPIMMPAKVQSTEQTMPTTPRLLFLLRTVPTMP